MALKTATKTDTNRVELIVEVDADSFEAAVSKAYKKNIGKMNIPGFRKGKAPRSFVEKIYGSGVFYEDASTLCIPKRWTLPLRNPAMNMWKIKSIWTWSLSGKRASFSKPSSPSSPRWKWASIKA